MATIHVDAVTGNNADNGSTRALAKKTYAAARAISANGDTIMVWPGTYKEEFPLSNNNQIVMSAEPYQAIIDGNYHDGLLSGGEMPPEDSDPSFLPGGEFDSMVTITGSGNTFSGFKIQNIAGEGIAIVGNVDDNIVDSNDIDHTYGGFINVSGATNTGAQDNIIRKNRMKRGNVKWLDETRGQSGGPSRVQVGLFTLRAKRTIIEDNELGFNYAEGISAGRGSQDTIIQRNLIYNTTHIALYAMRAVRTIMRYNVVIHTGQPPYTSSSNPEGQSDGIVIGDEDDSASFGPSSGTQVYGNLVVGSRRGFMVRTTADSSYTTVLSNTYVGYNTFVNNEDAGMLIQVPAAVNGVHSTTLVENNVIQQSNGRPVSGTQGSIPGVTFRSNTWSSQPDTGYRGTGDQYGNANLVAANAAISAIYPTLTFNKNNYRLTSASTRALNNTASGAANGVTPPAWTVDNGGSATVVPYDRGAFDFSGTAVGVIDAAFTAAPTSGAAPLNVAFTNTSTATNGITAYSWNFGDGSALNTTASPSHTYTAPGSYTVTLTVTGPDGTDTATGTITVTAAGVIDAAFTPSVTSGTTPTTVTFTNSSTATNGITSYSWNFGDGSGVSTQASPTHTYTVSGVYTVTLTVNGPDGTDTATTTITVTDTPVDLPDDVLCGPGVGTGTIYRRVEAGADDSTSNNGVFTNTGSIQVATDSSDGLAQKISIIIFDDVRVPAGATITNAELTLTPNAAIVANPSPWTLNVYPLVIVNPSAPANQTDFDDLFATIDGSNVASLDLTTGETDDLIFTGADMAGVVNRVVRESTWVEGARLGLALYDSGTDGAGSFHSFNTSALRAPLLKIQFSCVVVSRRDGPSRAADDFVMNSVGTVTQQSSHPEPIHRLMGASTLNPLGQYLFSFNVFTGLGQAVEVVSHRTLLFNIDNGNYQILDADGNIVDSGTDFQLTYYGLRHPVQPGAGGVRGEVYWDWAQARYVPNHSGYAAEPWPDLFEDQRQLALSL